MNKSTVLLGIAAVAAWFLYTQKKAIGMLSYSIQSVGLNFDGLTPILRLNILVQNVSQEAFVINAFVGNLVSNGDTIGTMSLFGQYAVPAASQSILPIDVRLSLIGVVSDIVNVIQKGSGIAQNVSLTGYVNASGVVAPVNLTYKIG